MCRSLKNWDKWGKDDKYYLYITIMFLREQATIFQKSYNSIQFGNDWVYQRLITSLAHENTTVSDQEL
jgi:hypothetical protein